VPRALIVIGEPFGWCAERALTRGDVDQLEAGRRRAAIATSRPSSKRRVIEQTRQLDRLQHRLVVLLLVA